MHDIGFADIQYVDIFQLILDDTDIFPFVWKQDSNVFIYYFADSKLLFFY